MISRIRKVIVIDYNTGQYRRRYKITAKQKAIFSCLALSENDVNEYAISSSYKVSDL